MNFRVGVGNVANVASFREVDYGKKSSEKSNLMFRRSLYVVKDIKKGELLTQNNIRSIRPGFGLAPKHFEKVLGLKSTCDIPRGTPLSFNFIS